MARIVGTMPASRSPASRPTPEPREVFGSLELALFSEHPPLEHLALDYVRSHARASASRSPRPAEVLAHLPAPPRAACLPPDPPSTALRALETSLGLVR